MSFRIFTWNVEWAVPESDRGRLISRKINDIDADVVVMTEGCRELLPADGHVIDGGKDWGYQLKDPRRRKVIVWSRHPWSEVDHGLESQLPSGRFVTGTTTAQEHTLRVMGICIPWRDAHVRSGRKDRSPWDDHLSYLSALKPLIREQQSELIVAGDFNQRVPRGNQPRHCFDALMETFAPITICTDLNIERPMIDHVAHSSDFLATHIEVVDNFHLELKLTDHRGVVVTLNQA